MPQRVCLLISLECLDPSANPTQLKRVVKAASVLSAYPEEGYPDPAVFRIGNEPHCACDLHVAGPDELGQVEIDSVASSSLERLLTELLNTFEGPFDIRVYWADQHMYGTELIDLAEFVELTRTSCFDGRITYRVSSGT